MTDCKVMPFGYYVSPTKDQARCEFICHLAREIIVNNHSNLTVNEVFEEAVQFSDKVEELAERANSDDA